LYGILEFGEGAWHGDADRKIIPRQFGSHRQTLLISSLLPTNSSALPRKRKAVVIVDRVRIVYNQAKALPSAGLAGYTRGKLKAPPSWGRRRDAGKEI
jgi:hypothetical protein